MKTLVAVVLLLLPFAVSATGGSTPPKPTKTVTKSVTQNVTQNANPNLSADLQVETSGGNAQAVGGSVAINTPAARIAVAPDILAYPTAPCRVSVGVSGGWIGGAIGASGSILDENCARIETSRQLYNLGQKDAALQIMCLSAEAHKALTAVGVVCKLKSDEPAEQTKP